MWYIIHFFSLKVYHFCYYNFFYKSQLKEGYKSWLHSA